jgi:hypothetical protein
MDRLLSYIMILSGYAGDAASELERIANTLSADPETQAKVNELAANCRQLETQLVGVHKELEQPPTTILTAEASRRLRVLVRNAKDIGGGLKAQGIPLPEDEKQKLDGRRNPMVEAALDVATALDVTRTDVGAPEIIDAVGKQGGVLVGGLNSIADNVRERGEAFAVALTGSKKTSACGARPLAVALTASQTTSPASALAERRPRFCRRSRPPSSARWGARRFSGYSALRCRSAAERPTLSSSRRSRPR